MSTTTDYGLTGALDRPELAREDGTLPGQPWRPSRAGYAARITVLVLLALLAITIPLMVPNVFVTVVARAVVFGIVALSMNMLVGYAGEVSLGHAAFVGVGAFGAGMVMEGAGMPFLIAFLVAGATGAVAAVLLGSVALRVRGVYLALVTIAYLFFVQNTIFNSRAITGGGAGQPVPRPAFAQGDVAFVYLCMAVLAVVWFVDWRLTSTKAGRAIQALRDDERVAASWGINVTGYKLLAFVLSGTVAAFAGYLFAATVGRAAPITFGLTLSLTFLFMTVVGGLGSRPGVVQGGIVFATIGTLLEQAHTVWGETGHCVTTWGAGAFQRIGTLDLQVFAFGVYGPGPRLLQGLIALALLGGGVAIVASIFRGRWSGAWALVGRTVGALLLLGLGAVTAVGVVSPGAFCMWEPIGALWEPLIGAALLVLTLIFFPGGIAQQQEDLLRWLSFRRFHEAEHAHSVAGRTGGGSDVRS